MTYLSPFIGMFVYPFALLSQCVNKTTENNTKYEILASMDQTDFNEEYPDFSVEK